MPPILKCGIYIYILVPVGEGGETGCAYGAGDGGSGVCMA